MPRPARRVAECGVAGRLRWLDLPRAAPHCGSAERRRLRFCCKESSGVEESDLRPYGHVSSSLRSRGQAGARRSSTFTTRRLRRAGRRLSPICPLATTAACSRRSAAGSLGPNVSFGIQIWRSAASTACARSASGLTVCPTFPRRYCVARAAMSDQKAADRRLCRGHAIGHHRKHLGRGMVRCRHRPDPRLRARLRGHPAHPRARNRQGEVARRIRHQTRATD